METHVDIPKSCMCTVGNETEYGNSTYPWYNATEEDCKMASFQFFFIYIFLVVESLDVYLTFVFAFGH